MRRLASIFWFLSLSVQAGYVCAEQNQITALNYSAPQADRVVFDLSAPTPYRYFVLKNPSRLVVDLNDTRSPSGLQQPPADHPLLAGVRSGMRNGKDLRVVFELKTDADAKAVVVDKSGGSQLQFDLAAKAQLPLAKLENAVEPAKPVKKDRAMQTVALAPKSNPIKPAKAKGRDIVIAIDAGHGGKDVGAQGANGTQEKDVVFAIAKRLQGLVNRQPGLKAVMIRDGDYFVKLKERVRLAQAAKADLFVSIHADAFSDESAHGASVYTLANKGATSAGARFLADSENASDAISGGLDDKEDALASVLMDLSQSAAKEASQNVGNKVLRSVKSVGHLHRSAVQKAGFVVLKSGDIPSILVETAFISNPDEERRLTTRAYQDKMASAVFGGIMSHFRQYAPANTLIAQLSKSGKASRLAVNEVPATPVVDKPGAQAAATVDIDAAPTNLKTASAAKSQHVIGRGETLSGIAQQYGVSMRELRLTNGMSDGNVRVGQVLQIPRSS